MNQETKHTLGPWHVGMKPGPIVYGPKGEQVADLRADLISKDERLANLRLIAAAPELLEALKGILAVANVRVDDPRCAAFDFARAAIAKATSR